jgi:hypothetical protein
MQTFWWTNAHDWDAGRLGLRPRPRPRPEMAEGVGSRKRGDLAALLPPLPATDSGVAMGRASSWGSVT